MVSSVTGSVSAAAVVSSAVEDTGSELFSSPQLKRAAVMLKALSIHKNLFILDIIAIPPVI